MRARTVCAAFVLASASAAASAHAQRGYACNFSWDNAGYFISPYFAGNPVYDGRVTFTRIKYRGNWACGGEGPGWSHDYPTMEGHFTRMLDALTTMHAFVEKGNVEGGAIFSWADPEVFKYPVAYMSELAGWDLNDHELTGFRNYIRKGGFVIFDDMGSRNVNHLSNLVYQWHRAFPQAKLVELKPDNAIFNAFYKVNLAIVPGYYSRDCGNCPARYYGFYEDNDESKRLVAVINDHQDFGEYIQFSEQGFQILPTNEAYKLMINYFVYALTH